MKLRYAFVLLLLLVPAFILFRAPQAGARAPGDAGMAFVDMSADECRRANLKHGVMVVDVVVGGPADRKGIEEGDILTKYDDQPVRSSAWLAGRIRRDGAGFLAGIHYLRDGEEHWAGLLTLAAAPPPPSPEQVDARIAALEQQVDALTRRVDALEQSASVAH